MSSAGVEVGSQTPQKLPQNGEITNGHTTTTATNGDKHIGEHEEMQYLNLIRKIIETGQHSMTGEYVMFRSTRMFSM